MNLIDIKLKLYKSINNINCVTIREIENSSSFRNYNRQKGSTRKNSDALPVKGCEN